MAILHVATFNKKLYKLHGKKLIDSVVSTNSTYTNPYKFLFVLKDLIFGDTRENIFTYSTKNDSFSKTWTRNKIDIIPKIYGGLYQTINANYTYKYFLNLIICKIFNQQPKLFSTVHTLHLFH